MKNYFLTNNEIHTWIIQLDAFYSEIPFFWGLLSHEEKSKSKKFAFEFLSKRYVVSHGVLRFLLSKYLNTASFHLHIGDYGKPYVKDSTLFFNLSHSHNYAAIALAPFEVGIDIECMKNDEVLTSIFSDNELLQFNTLPEGQKLQTFYHSWTKKEAYLKAIGTGLTHSPAEVEVSFETPQDWSFFPLNFDSGYVGTVASKSQFSRHIMTYFQKEVLETD